MDFTIASEIAISDPSLNNFTRSAIPYNPHYAFVPLKSEHIDAVTDLFTHAFCDDEPMTHYLAMQYPPYRLFARQVVENAVLDGMSVVALQNGNPVACALVEDLADPKPFPADFDKNFKYILALLESLGTHYFKDKKLPKGKFAHLFITAVDKAHRHQGLSIQVNFHAMNIATKQNYDYMYSELTHHYNEFGLVHHLRNRIQLIGQQNYNEFICENKKPFSELSGHATSYLWEIRPGKEIPK